MRGLQSRVACSQRRAEPMGAGLALGPLIKPGARGTTRSEGALLGRFGQTPQVPSGLCGVMARSPRTAPSWALWLRLLALLRPPGLGEACSCAPAHPQQHVCRSALGESGGPRGPQQGWLCGVGMQTRSLQGKGGAPATADGSGGPAPWQPCKA